MGCTQRQWLLLISQNIAYCQPAITMGMPCSALQSKSLNDGGVNPTKYKTDNCPTRVINVTNIDLPHIWFFQDSSMHVANVYIVLP